MLIPSTRFTRHGGGIGPHSDGVTFHRFLDVRITR
jgi:hypothetical protein